MEITGPLFLNEEYIPPRDLVDFLEDGETPIYIGYFTMFFLCQFCI